MIEANGVINFDFTGANMVQPMITELRGQGIDVMLARMELEVAQHAAERAGLLTLLGPNHVFRRWKMPSGPFQRLNIRRRANQRVGR